MKEARSSGWNKPERELRVLAQKLGHSDRDGRNRAFALRPPQATLRLGRALRRSRQATHECGERRKRHGAEEAASLHLHRTAHCASAAAGPLGRCHFAFARPHII